MCVKLCIHDKSLIRFDFRDSSGCYRSIATDKVSGLRSFIWTLFEIKEDDNQKVRCLLCKKELRRGGAHPGTSMMINHAKNLHPEDFNEAKNSGLEIGEFPKKNNWEPNTEFWKVYEIPNSECRRTLK